MSAAPILLVPPKPGPLDFEAEMAVLGIALSSQAGLDALRGELRPEMFADDRHGAIFAALCAMADQGQPPDAIGLKTWAEGRDELANLGGWQYLVRLAGSTVTAISWRSYALLIADLWRKRRLVQVFDDMAKRARTVDPEKPTVDLLSDLDGEVQAIFDESGDGIAQPASRAVAAALATADAAGRGEIRAINTGYSAIDRLTGGLPRTGLVVLGARPGMGKTALALGIAAHVARTRHVAFFSLEMSAEELGRRMLAGFSGVPLGAIKRAPGVDAWPRLLQAQTEIGALAIDIDERPALQYAQVRARAKGLARRTKLGLIIVDHIGLMRAPPEVERHGATQRIEFISGGLKRLAKECGCPVLAICQLNRAVEGRDDRRPGLSDLRQSGAIEQDADIVAFLYREHYYAKRYYPQQAGGESEEVFQERLAGWRNEISNVEPRADLIIAKQRDDDTGVARLQWDGPTVWFSDPERAA